jgi:hypothetical protein
MSKKMKQLIKRMKNLRCVDREMIIYPATGMLYDAVIMLVRHVYKMYFYDPMTFNVLIHATEIWSLDDPKDALVVKISDNGYTIEMLVDVTIIDKNDGNKTYDRKAYVKIKEFDDRIKIEIDLDPDEHRFPIMIYYVNENDDTPIGMMVATIMECVEHYNDILDVLN